MLATDVHRFGASYTHVYMDRECLYQIAMQITLVNIQSFLAFPTFFVLSSGRGKSLKFISDFSNRFPKLRLVMALIDAEPAELMQAIRPLDTQLQVKFTLLPPLLLLTIS